MTFDPEEFGKHIGTLIRDACAPLLKRIEQLEARQPERGEKGADAEPIDIAQVVASKDFQTSAELHISKALETYFTNNPIAHGKDGAPGIAGEKGERGEKGADAEPIDIKDVASEVIASEEFHTITGIQLVKAVSTHFANNPISHGKDGAPGIPGEKGERGEKGDAGSDGVGLAGAMIDRAGELIITTTKGEAIQLGSVVGKDGAPGTDGLGFDDLSAEYDGERGLTLKFQRADRVKEFNLRLPMMIHRGFYRDGMDVKQYDSVTHDGSLWYALRDTKVKPCYENKEDWQLAARKGRDGEKGAAGKDYTPVKVNLNG